MSNEIHSYPRRTITFLLFSGSQLLLKDRARRNEEEEEALRSHAEENDAYILERGCRTRWTRFWSLRLLLQALWIACLNHWYSFAWTLDSLYFNLTRLLRIILESIHYFNVELTARDDREGIYVYERHAIWWECSFYLKDECNLE